MGIDLRPHNIVSHRRVRDLPSALLIQTDSHPSEDFILTDEIPIDPPSAPGDSSVAVFMNPAIDQSEALIIQNGELFYVCREPLSSSGWNFFGLGAGFPCIAPVNAAGGWAFANDGSIWQNVAGAWNAPSTGPVPAKTATGTDGTIWGNVGLKIAVFDTVSLQWTNPPASISTGFPSPTIPSGSMDNLWVAEADPLVPAAVYHYDPTYGWQTVGNINVEMASVTVGFDGSVWGVAKTHTVYLYNPATEADTNPWQVVGGITPFIARQFVSIGRSAGWALGWFNPTLLYITISENLEYNYQQREGPFQLTGGPYAPSIALGVDQTLWLTDSFGTVWKYLPSSPMPWQRQMMPPGVSGTTAGWNIGDVAAMADGGGTVHAFFTCGGSRTGLYTTTLQNGDWQQPTAVSITGSDASTTYGPLSIQRDATTGDVVVCAAASNGQLMLARGSSGSASGALLGSAQPFSDGQPLQLVQLRKPRPMAGMAMQAKAGEQAAPDLNDVKYDAFLANDRTLADPEVISVKPGGRVLLRVINGAAMSNFHLDLGALNAELTAVDGFRVRPLTARRFPIAVAQQLDIQLAIPRGAAAHPVLAILEGSTRQTGLVLRAGSAAVARIPRRPRNPPRRLHWISNAACGPSRHSRRDGWTACTR